MFFCFTIKIHPRSKSTRSKSTQVKIHPIKNNPSQNQPDKIHPVQNPSDQNQPELKPNRVEEKFINFYSFDILIYFELFLVSLFI